MATQSALSRHLLTGLGLFSMLFLASEAFAHARWNPEGVLAPRSNSTNIKDNATGNRPKAPCGNTQRIPNNEVNKQPVQFTSGATIDVQWEITVFHEGYFRVRFSKEGDKNWEDNVLLDNVRDKLSIGIHTAKITLPDIECDQCTLQLVQVMEGRTPPNYYSCADIVLSKPKINDTTPPSDISALVANPAEGKIDLSWTNPAEDFSGALILQANNEVAATPVVGTEYQLGDSVGNAKVIALGTATSKAINNLNAGQQYYFKAFAYDDSFNYSSGVSVSAQVPMVVINQAPVVSLRHEQMSGGDDIVFTDKGLVLVQASVNDDDGDQHSFDWSQTDPALIDTDNSEINFTFDPSNLAPGEYTLKVIVSDDGSPVESGSQSLRLTVQEPAIENAAPSVSVEAQQLGRDRLTAYQTDGKMILYADVSDDNLDDEHTYEWSASNAAIIDIDARDNYFIFQAADVPVGVYTVSLKITDNGTPAKSVETQVEITVEEKKKGGSLGFIYLSLFACLLLLSRKYKRV